MPDPSAPALRELIDHAVTDLSRAGVDSPRVDAELLVAHVLGLPRGRLALVDALTAEEVVRYRDLIRLRAARVPLQHLTGSAPFWKFDLAVGPGVFIPRPETELLVEWGVAVLRGTPAPVVVDLCSGSGAIALAVAHELPKATVYAVDKDPDALDWLRRNAADRLAAGDRAIEVVEGDATDPAVLSSVDGTVDLVLCNPPYVPDGAEVGPEVRGYDPYHAVFAGADGLDVIRGIAHRGARLLRPGGRIAIEHDDTHGAAVPALVAERYDSIEARRDLAGRPRFTTARRLADCTS